MNPKDYQFVQYLSRYELMSSNTLWMIKINPFTSEEKIRACELILRARALYPHDHVKAQSAMLAVI